jgi:O-antigen/teichoic acid export membrane protein
MIAFLFAVLLLPIFSKMIKMKESVEQLVKLAFTLLITISVIVAAGSFFYSYELMELLYDSEITESAEVFKLIMGGFIAISTTYVFGTLLTANGSLKQLNIVAAGGVLLNLILNIILVPKLLAVGSAYASLITQFIIAIIQVIIVQSIFKFKINYKFLLSIVFFIPGVILINVLSKKLQFSWEINFILMVAISLLYAFILKLLSIKSFIKILKE